MHFVGVGRARIGLDRIFDRGVGEPDRIGLVREQVHRGGAAELQMIALDAQLELSGRLLLEHAELERLSFAPARCVAEIRELDEQELVRKREVLLEQSIGVERATGIRQHALVLIEAHRSQLRSVDGDRSRIGRRQVADDLYRALVSGDYSFWIHIHPLFLSRDITRHDIRELVRRGLSTTRGSYRGLLELFKIPNEDYKRFMNFLATHDSRPDFREFRSPSAEMSHAPRIVRAPLPPLERPGAEGGELEVKKAAS